MISTMQTSTTRRWMTTTLNEAGLIRPDWPAPDNVWALQTTRAGGISLAPYASMNLGDHVADDPLHVAANRQRLQPWLPSEPVWMRQVHGTVVVCADKASCLPEADAAYARQPNTVCTVMTADCLPLLFCDRAGSVVAAAHAGWRGLLAGVIEATISDMAVAPGELMAWLGPAIGPEAFEVGVEVRQMFVDKDAAATQAFAPTVNGKWLADIYQLARGRLRQSGVNAVYGGQYCTYQDDERFFSYRRDGVTGRMASMVWLVGEHV